jgi:murein L,D-transpeptidase YcbB/YkuD
MLTSQGPDSPVGAYLPSVRRQITAFYERRGFRPAWVGGLLELQRAQAVLAVLGRAEEHGLRNQDYAAPKVLADGSPRPGRETAEYDLALTEAVLRYSRDVAVGRVRPASVYRDVQLPPPDFDPVAFLTQMLRSTSIAASLVELAPPHPEYQRLVRALAHYRAIAAEGGWPSIPGRDDVDPIPNSRRVELLVQRLALEDPHFAEVADPSPEDLRHALERFQSRNGLPADGRLSPSTLAALNVPVAKRIEQIVANMERWRWVPRSFEDRYIAVNVPDQSLEYVRDGDTVLSSRVIIGRTNSTTPILYTTITGIVFNPAWEIPGDIVVNQLLPKLRQNPRYLVASNMVLANGPADDPQGVKVNWRNVSAREFPYRLVQIPGPTNALGHIMLDSPNDFDVYLHDTPAKALFNTSVRTVSNGCVRVEAIRPLAALALADGDEGAEQRIAEMIELRDTQRLPLDRPLPVYFLYWTAIAADDGTSGFRRDFYSRDEPLLRALDAPPQETDEPANLVASDRVALTRVSDTFIPAEAQDIPQPDQDALDQQAAEDRQFAERDSVEPTRLTGRTAPSAPRQTRSARGRPETPPLFPRVRAWLDSKPFQQRSAR